jgi:hypothetical protein
LRPISLGAQPMKPSGKTSSSVSESTLRRLNMYALAASAAGVGALALTQSAEARIVYTPVCHVVGKNGRYKLDLNHDKITDFTLVNTHGCNTDFCVDVLSAVPAAGNGVVGVRGFLSIPYASALPRGAVIGPAKPFLGQFMASSESGQGTIGRWLNVKNHYLGLKFQINGKTHFGWARLSVQVSGSAFVRATLTGYAYETIANKAIVAGRTTSDVDEKLEANQPPPPALVLPASPPATLGLLALGSPALSVWRKEQR